MLFPRQEKAIGKREAMRGVLIIEMLAAFAIISTTLIIAADSFIVSNRGNEVARRQVELSDALAFALADINRESKASDSYMHDIQKITMQRIAGLNNQTADTVSYFVQDNVLYKQVNSESALRITPPLVKVVLFDVNVYLNSVVQDFARVNLVARHIDGPSDPPIIIQTVFYSQQY